MRLAMMIRSIVTTLSVLIAMPARSETVDVKYRGVVDLKPFACTDTPRSSFIQRVCYDKAESYMLVNLRQHLLPLLRIAGGRRAKRHLPGPSRAAPGSRHRRGTHWPLLPQG